VSNLISCLSSADEDFDLALSNLLSREETASETVRETVKNIICDIREKGDIALLELTQRFDQRTITSVEELVVGADQIKMAFASISEQERSALTKAADRIRNFHGHQKLESWQYTERNGTVLGQRITPLDRVGVYAPGGKAAYPSSVLMAAIPAQVAGVEEVVLVTPAPGGKINDIVLAAAAVAGIDRILTIGGAQAVAALAYGTGIVPKVDKIVGPGNIFVATAKREVFGVVDIDMIAGPSEILVISDGTTDPEWVAMDLFSQAEHDEQAQAILISPDQFFIDNVLANMKRLLPGLQRKNIIATSLRNRGALIKVDSLDQAIDIANTIAPEHLELSVENADELLGKIRHAGAIFVGRYTSESLGDYCAGPNHVLPTSGTARFSSPLGVYDYVKRSSVIQVSPTGADELGVIASTLAHSESLEAHARSAELRMKK